MLRLLSSSLLTRFGTSERRPLPRVSGMDVTKKPTRVLSEFAHSRQETIIVSKMMRVLKNGSRGLSAASPEEENRPVWAYSHIQASPILVDAGYHRTGRKEYGNTLNFEMSIPFSMLRLSL